MDCSKVPLRDKGCHAIAGFMIAIAVSLLTAPIWGFAAGVAAGLAKEAWDRYSYGGGDFFDLFATVAGTFSGLFLYGLIGNLL